ncbi:MAG TPA: hypothetical protein VFF13_02370 [archaeon]|nr:hypothetical protein [archaeon]
MLKGLRERLKWLDPFTYVDHFVMPVVNPDKNKTLETIVYIIFAFIFAFVLYNFVLVFLLGTNVPLVIVFSGSMEPVLYRGDVVVLIGASSLEMREANIDFPIRNRPLLEYAELGSRLENNRDRHASIKVNGEEFEFDPNGPIVVYHSALTGQDIIHRAVLKLHAPDGNFVLTLGDNNNRLDEDCPINPVRGECIETYPVPAENLKGKYLFHIPLVGYVKLLLFDDLPRLIFG